MIDPVLKPNDAFAVADSAVRQAQRARGHVFPDAIGDAHLAAGTIAKCQHKATLIWLRERLEAGDHLEDLLDL